MLALEKRDTTSTSPVSLSLSLSSPKRGPFYRLPPFRIMIDRSPSEDTPTRKDGALTWCTHPENSPNMLFPASETNASANSRRGRAFCRAEEHRERASRERESRGSCSSLRFKRVSKSVLWKNSAVRTRKALILREPSKGLFRNRGRVYAPRTPREAFQ